MHDLNPRGEELSADELGLVTGGYKIRRDGKVTATASYLAADSSGGERCETDYQKNDLPILY